MDIIIVSCKYYRIFHTFSTAIKKNSGVVAQRKDSDIAEVTCRSDIMKYQETMNGIDRDNHNRVVGEGLYNG